ncbi:MAG: PDDEXK nuclease domain-containing protein [Pyrinomonadaceae bacterium]
MPNKKSQIEKDLPNLVQMKYENLLEAIATAHQSTQSQAVQAVNLALTLRNWLIGYYLVEYEQNGQDRANYGEKLLETLSKDLRKRLGRGFAQRNLEMFRVFYSRYQIPQSVIAKFRLALPSSPSVEFERFDWQDDDYFTQLFRKLSWTHFIELMRIDDKLKRAFYEIQTLENTWSVRELKRQTNSLLYERVGLSRDKEGVLNLAKTGEILSKPSDIIRDPYIFEFLELKGAELYSETQLEKALLDKLQNFLLELGQGFCFVGRQKRITFDNEHYYIDLLLYNRRLKCLFAIDLMLGKFRHEYAGAMNFYLNYLQAEEIEEGENPPIGLLLCSEKNETHVEYALGGLSNQVFVSRYQLHLPTQEELEQLVQKTRRLLEK